MVVCDDQRLPLSGLYRKEFKKTFSPYSHRKIPNCFLICHLLSAYMCQILNDIYLNFLTRETLMISVTPYTFQPATCRIVRLWKNARAVSDWFTLTVCPCCEASMSSATSTYTNTSEPSTSKQSQLLATPVVDTSRGTGEPFQPHHVVIDFSPRPEDTDEVQDRCLEFLKLINNKGDRSDVCTSKIDEVIPEESSTCSTRCKEKSLLYDAKDDFPAIHTFKQLQAKDAVRAAFETSVTKPPTNC